MYVYYQTVHTHVLTSLKPCGKHGLCKPQTDNQVWFTCTLASRSPKGRREGSGADLGQLFFVVVVGCVDELYAAECRFVIAHPVCCAGSFKQLVSMSSVLLKK
jgi:hypothetical protein